MRVKLPAKTGVRTRRALLALGAGALLSLGLPAAARAQTSSPLATAGGGMPAGTMPVPGGQAPFLTEAPADPTACHPLAELFGQRICREELRPEAPNGQPVTPADKAESVAERVKQRNLQRLKDLVWQRALIRKFGAKAVTPGEAEVDNFRAQFDAAINGSYDSDKKTVALVQGLLAKNSYAPDNEAKLKAILNAAQTSVKFYEQRQAHSDTLPVDYKFIVQAAERQVAYNMLTGWKNDKLLFDAYGGQVATTQAGPQPADAYKAFLKYIEREGHLKILDPDYKDVIAETNRYIASLHPTAADTELARQYFADPARQFKFANNDARFNQLRYQLEAVPATGPRPGAAPKDMIGKRSLPPTAH